MPEKNKTQKKEEPKKTAPVTERSQSRKDLRILGDSFIGRIESAQRVSAVRMGWQDFWRKASSYLSREELILLGEGFVFSSHAHGEQLRHSGEPYIVHPLLVATVLADIGMDAETLTAALLHDVLEDTPISEEELAERFGKNVAFLVGGVTKLGRIHFQTLEDYQAENLRKMFLVMAKDIRVVLIKLADRLHNMRTLRVLPKEKQMRIARETQEIYAPLAHRLGIYHIKQELEDLSYRTLDPDTYYEIRRRVKKKLPERENIVKKAIDILQKEIVQTGIDMDITGRAKHFYSIYEKMCRKNLSVDQLYDLLAVRVIVNTVVECYTVLGIVHTLWKPIPGQFDDYIANPKNNMYQSLHTTVVGPSAEPLEVQIRTWEMHELAEYGVAAHWRYKEKKKGSVDSLDQKLVWIRQALEDQGEDARPTDFLEHLKEDVLTSEVFVFTPKGDVINLPHGSTPIDFAYTVHTEVGHKCVGAMINGRIVPIDYTLQNGDIVKVHTSPQGHPSRDWLKIARSNRARSKIRSWFRQQEKAEKEKNHLRGEEILEKEIRRRLGDSSWEASKEGALLNRSAKSLGHPSWEELITEVGAGNQNASKVAARVVQHIREKESLGSAPPPLLEEVPRDRKGDSEIFVEGAEGVLVGLANCCAPIPGDVLVGLVTKSRGIMVHREDCPNVRSFPEDRKIDVSWGNKVGSHYNTRLKLEGADRPGLFGDVSQAVNSAEASLVGIKAAVRGRNQAMMTLEIQVRSIEHLYKVMAMLNAVPGIQRVFRG
ncbi:MAG TPA: bifunctional (p)ppGpp synthetase/guanosine-3',5'-bis(diphosphate) 3'-pyrophosphohydrolase [Synergistaceae bacterium]|nr:bifunctional (p)ppGpp synthetase/guanosine-3',5'-bis(diphosphate) 3'-pyrophosphohydrolase [Synergistaceae bacterium]HPJ24733.1 bifunctional (p)ppGpp synthetase/guanosine-3',5'-bis(diphosphate) 3'-pyrophosphohydrolase [Synergistaceae bacterium]HPQ37074.1 bifunctional (p)ppGpp synthetase/guanosine-3',5'-bis(diphosphate) 3'-pyrophosphohydrolase [Synergistaceae bacterium]